MGYYANGGGTLKLKKDMKVPASILADLGREFSEVADSPDDGLWLTFEYDKYHEDDVTNALRNLAPFVESGNVEFSGDDDEHWRFHFWNGTMRYQYGRLVYEDADPDWRRVDRQEMIGEIIDIFEDWLADEKGVTPEMIPCDDREDDNDALIYGFDYGTLEGRIEQVLINNELIEEEK